MPSKDYGVTEINKISKLKYIINRKDAKIKTSEMENELMRDFIFLTERKWEKYQISVMCRYLDVSRSRYYDYAKRIDIP